MNGAAGRSQCPPSAPRSVEERPATLNRMRGLLAEFGEVPQKVNQLQRGLAAALERLPPPARRVLEDLRGHVAIARVAHC